MMQQDLTRAVGLGWGLTEGTRGRNPRGVFQTGVKLPTPLPVSALSSFLVSLWGDTALSLQQTA